MQAVAALLRRQQAIPCIRSAGASWHWEALRQGLVTSQSANVCAQIHDSAPQALAAGAAAAAAAASRPPRVQRQPLPDVLAQERAPALALRRRMQHALDRREFSEVLRLLHESEGIPGDVGAAPIGSGSSAGSTAAAPAASWHPYDRAALFDCALWACAQRADPEEARRLIDRMWKEQVPVGILANTAMIKALCAVGRRAAALEHLRSVPTKRQRTPMYTWLLRACIEAGDLSTARECYATFLRRQLPPDVHLHAEVIKMHGAAGELAAAEAAWCQAGGAAAAAAATAARKAAEGGAAGGEASAAVAAEKPEPDQACLHAAWVAALAKAGRLDAAVAALEAMLDRFAAVLPVEVSLPRGDATVDEPGSAPPAPQLRGGAPGSLGGGAAAAAAASQPASARVVRHLQQARNAVLAAAQELGQHAVSKRASALATLRGLPPDVGTYNGLLLGTLSHGDGLQAVLEGVHEMRALGMRPDWQTYALVLRAAAAERDAPAAQAAFDGMAADGVVPSRLHHNLLLQAYSQAGDLQGTDAAYLHMRAAGFAPNAHAFGLLLDSVRQWNALDVAGRAEAGGEFGAKRERSHQRQLASELLGRWAADLDASRPTLLNQELFTALLHAYGKCGQIYHVLALMRDAFGARLMPSTEDRLGRHGGGDGSGGKGAAGGHADAQHGAAAAAAAAGEAAAGAADAAQQQWAALQPGLPDQRSSSSLEDGGSSSRSSSESGGSSSSSVEAAEVWHRQLSDHLSPLSQQTLERAGLQPSLRIFNAAIGACTRVGHMHLADAVALLRSMLAAGLSPDVHTYTSLISGCAYGRQAALARELFRQMEESGVQPTGWTHNAMLSVECWTYGVDAGLALLRERVARGGQPDRATWNTLLASARHFKRADVAAIAMEQLADEQERQDAAAAQAAAEQQEAALAAAAAGQPSPDDHQWHGYYERQQDEEDEW